MESELREDIEHAINRHSGENSSNTPDFILADYLMDCLAAFDRATQQRENWYGRDPHPSEPGSRLNRLAPDAMLAARSAE